MYMENNLSGLGRFKLRMPKPPAPKAVISKALAIHKASPITQATRAILSKATSIHKASPLTTASIRVAKKAVSVHEKMPMTKLMIKHQGKVGKVLRPIAKVVSFVPGWIGMVGGALTALDTIATARRNKKLQAREAATTQAEIDKIDAEIRAIEEGGTPVDDATVFPKPVTENAVVGAKTAMVNDATVFPKPVTENAVVGAKTAMVNAEESAEFPPAIGEEKPKEKKPLPWTLIAGGLVTALTLLK